MRIACVLINHLRARVELRRKPHLRVRPAVIVDRATGKALVVDAFPSASGVVAGMTLEEALSRRPDTTVLEADEPACRRVFRQVISALQGVSDRVKGAELGTVYAGLDGLEALHGGEAALVRALREAIPRDLAPQVGVAEAKFPAFVAARTGRGPESVTVPGEAAPFLAPRSIDLLPLSPDVRDGLLRFGLYTMGAAVAATERPPGRTNAEAQPHHSPVPGAWHLHEDPPPRVRGTDPAALPSCKRHGDGGWNAVCSSSSSAVKRSREGWSCASMRAWSSGRRLAGGR